MSFLCSGVVEQNTVKTGIEPIANHQQRTPGYNLRFERQKSAPRREVIRFILYLSIHLPDTRSTFQSQRVFFIEDPTFFYGFLALT